MSAGVHFDYWYFQGELEKAATQGDIEVIKILISIGIDVDLKDIEENETALMVAASSGNLEIVKLLVEAGANINYWSRKYQMNPLLEAAYAGEKEIYDYLYPLAEDEIKQRGELEIYRGIEYKRRRRNIAIESFINSAKWGDSKAIRSGIKAGIEIDAIGSDGLTALMCAAENAHISVIKILLQSGANPYILSDYFATMEGYTALMRGVETNYREVIKTFAEAGINLDFPGKDGLTALMYAMRARYTDSANYLIEFGANLNIRDDSI
jgi:ankyrin repeat protein